MQPLRRYFIGDSCVCWSLGTRINEPTSARVLRAYRTVKSIFFCEPGFRDVVPSYTALAVHFDPLTADVSDLSGKIEAILNRPDEVGHLQEGHRVTLHVSYTGEDLARVAHQNNLSIRQVIDRHRKPVYTVAMIGFMPHFPYLIGLDPTLETPRLDIPRTKVPAGAVAIGGAQTGIYPSVSPGGWNIIGLTDPSCLKTLVPGDRVMFEEGVL